MKRRVLSCPQCGSINLHVEAGMLIGQVYHCKSCDYVGSLVVQKEVEIEEG
ncbi:MAG: hypothetical protein LN412_00850 [Candidatus Thermoplasmatota archaeon]|nr:hypothetical protein [Candidatus Thermoplasmatota archaeon]